MHRLRVTTFGTLTAWIPQSGAVVRFPTRKAAALTVFVALQRNGQAPRDTIAEMLWNDVPAHQARHSLRQTLLEIRRALNAASDGLGDDLLVTTRDDIVLRPSHVVVDVQTFRRCAERRARRALATACALYRGEFLAGLQTREPAFDLWTTNQRSRLHAIAVEVHEQHIAQLLKEQKTAAALDTAFRLLEIDPFHEPAHRIVMTLYAGRGEVSAAKRHYEALAILLRKELDVDPAPDTRELLRSVLRDRSGHDLHGGWPVRPLGAQLAVRGLDRTPALTRRRAGLSK